MNLLEFLYLNVEVVSVSLHLLQSPLGIQAVRLHVFLPDLIELRLKIVAFLLVAFDFDF